MIKIQRLFRYVWRVNAVLILFAAAGVSFAVVTLMWSSFGGSGARDRVFEAAPPLGGADSDERLVLGQVALVQGTSALRGELVAHRSGAGFSSGSSEYSETRNLLFVDGQSDVGRWLLPDDDHVITEHPDIVPEAEDRGQGRPVATVALVKPAHGDSDVTDGTLLLFDPAGRHIQTVADGVRALHSATLDGGGRIALLFERRRKYVIASFDGTTLEKKEEHEITVPALK
jgi:hypothetical protein